MEIENFRGVWRNRDMPPNFYFDNDIQITIYAEGRIVVWTLRDNNESKVLVEGEYTIQNNNDGTFQIIIDGFAVNDNYLNLKGEFYIPGEPPSIVVTMPILGRRYFEKIR